MMPLFSKFLSYSAIILERAVSFYGPAGATKDSVSGAEHHLINLSSVLWPLEPAKNSGRLNGKLALT